MQKSQISTVGQVTFYLNAELYLTKYQQKVLFERPYSQGGGLKVRRIGEDIIDADPISARDSLANNCRFKQLCHSRLKYDTQAVSI